MARKDGSPGRFAQIKETYKLTKKTDPKIGLILLGIFLAVFLPLLVIGIILVSVVPILVVALKKKLTMRREQHFND